MRTTVRRLRDAVGAFTFICLTIALAGCAAPQATQVGDELPFDQAVVLATDGLAGQTQKLPGFLAKVESKINKRGVVLDPMLDATTGQQTAATTLLQDKVVERLTTKFDQFEILPFRAANLSRLAIPADRHDDAGPGEPREEGAADQPRADRPEERYGGCAGLGAGTRGRPRHDARCRTTATARCCVKDPVIEGYIAHLGHRAGAARPTPSTSNASPSRR